MTISSSESTANSNVNSRHTANVDITSQTPLIELKNLVKHFPLTKKLFSKKRDVLRAVDGINLTLYRGETLGLVGESGCGKSTLARTVIRLYEPTSGQILFASPENSEENHFTDIAKLENKAMQPFRLRMQMIFQDPYSSLNARMKVRDLIEEPLIINQIGTPESRTQKVKQLLRRVGLTEQHANRFPHELSGGQRQRIGIARAIALDPELIICDEPISALDVSIQAQVINMLDDLQDEMGLTYLFITHDLSMVRHIADRIGVMYLGKIIELATSEQLFNSPKHPYTQGLIASIPVASPKRSSDLESTLVEASSTETKNIAKHDAEQAYAALMKGELPSPINLPSGCRFRTRCSKATERCMQEEPELLMQGAEHSVACHYPTF